MRIFELHFNQKPRIKAGDTAALKSNKPEKIFDSFSYEPQNVYEKRMGTLIMVAELEHALPQDFKLMESLANVIKSKYYVFPLKTPEQSLKESLKKANEFLSEEVKKDNVSWLGNLSFAPIIIKGTTLIFTKVGEIKVLLLRQGTITDVSKNLELQDIEPYPLKVFHNIVSGNLAINDKLLIFTKEAYESFKTNGLIEEIAKQEQIDEKKIKDGLKKRSEELTKISGVCLIAEISESNQEEFPKIFNIEKEKEKFSLKNAVSPFLKSMKKTAKEIKKNTKEEKPNLERVLLKAKQSLSKITESLAKSKKPKKKLLSNPISYDLKDFLKKAGGHENRRNVIIVSSLLLLLIFGFAFFKGEAQKGYKDKETSLTQIESILNSNQSLTNETAIENLEGALASLDPLINEDWPQKSKAQELKTIIESKLEKAFLVQNINEPTVFSSFNSNEFLPQKLSVVANSLFLFSPISNKVVKVNISTKETETFSFPESISGISAISEINGNAILFSKPDKIFVLKSGLIEGPITLDLPDQSSDLSGFLAFQKNLYFFDSYLKEVIKYQYLGPNRWDQPEVWRKPDLQHNFDLVSGSIAIDGFVWLLTNENSVLKYWYGEYKEELIFDLFPETKKIYKIYATNTSPFLYLLEPMQKRVVIIEKSGLLFKQLKSDNFDNLKDLGFSENGRTLWILNGVKIFEVKF